MVLVHMKDYGHTVADVHGCMSKEIQHSSYLVLRAGIPGATDWLCCVGANIIRTMTKLRAAHADSPGCSIGINGETGQITDMKDLGIWEPVAVKLQTLKTSVEAAVLLLRIDDIVSGMKKSSRAAAKPTPAGAQVEGDGDNVDSERMLAE